MGLREIKDEVDRQYPGWPRKQKIALIKEVRDSEAEAEKAGTAWSLADEVAIRGDLPADPPPSVRVIPKVAQIRADETVRKNGLTFGDLCALVDKGRALGVDPTTVVLGDYWLGNKVLDRAGYRSRWLEI